MMGGYFTKIYLNILRLWNRDQLKSIHIRWGTNVNFSKHSVALSFFFEIIERFQYLESLKLWSFGLDADNLLDSYTEIIQSFRLLKHLNLSNNMINDECIKRVLFIDEFEQEYNITEYRSWTYPCMVYLNVCRNHLSSDGVSEIKSNWRKISPVIKTLIIHPQVDEEDPHKQFLKKFLD